MRYLFDSDVLIGAARLHYNPVFCEAFWSWVIQGHVAGLFFSIDKVKSEIFDGRADPLQAWGKRDELASFFDTSLPSLAEWGKITKEAVDPKRGFKEGAIRKFLNAEKADAWLISYASHYKNFTIVTNEASAPEATREIKLPDAAGWLGVKTMTLSALLRSYAVKNFTLNHGVGAEEAPGVRRSLLLPGMPPVLR